MKVQVKVGKKWRDADATINALGHAVVPLKYPYEPAIFTVWRKVRKSNGRGKK